MFAFHIMKEKEERDWQSASKGTFNCNKFESAI